MNLNQNFPLYLGCECETPDGIGQIYGVYRSGRIIVKFGYGLRYYAWDEIKPILRRIESLTEDEATKLIRMYYDGYSLIADIEVTKHEIRFKCCYHSSTRKWRKYLSFHQLGADQFLYLLSLGIDLFGLIDNKLAIEKTT